MKTITLKSVQIDDGCYLRRSAERADYDMLIDEDCIILADNSDSLFPDNNVIGIYIRMTEESVCAIREMLGRAPTNRGERSNGLPTEASIFGSLPRANHRNAACRFSAHTLQAYGMFERVLNFAREIDRLYALYMPGIHAAHLRMVQNEVPADWTMSSTPFTTFNLNMNIAIKYHRDTGNFRGFLSNVLILQSDIAGGELVFPEFRFAFSQQDRFLGIFNGQRWIHGCTRITRGSNASYRCSAVFYALEAMKYCYPFAAEFEHVKQWRTGVESSFRPSARSIHSGGGAANL